MKENNSSLKVGVLCATLMGSQAMNSTEVNTTNTEVIPNVIIKDGMQVTGGYTNEGTIQGDLSVIGPDTSVDVINNDKDGVIEGDINISDGASVTDGIVNSGSIAGGISVSGGAKIGNITNNGVIGNISISGGSVENITNEGTISEDIVIDNAEVSGDITNSGHVNGNIEITNNSVVKGDINLNKTSQTGAILNSKNSTIGAILNHSNNNLNILNSEDSVILRGVTNTAGGVIEIRSGQGSVAEGKLGGIYNKGAGSIQLKRIDEWEGWGL